MWLTKTPIRLAWEEAMLMTAKEAKEGIGSPDVLVKMRTKVYGKSDLILNGLIVCWLQVS